MVGMVVEDAFENIRECTHVEEAAELASLVKSVVDSQGAAARSIAPRFIQIVRHPSHQTILPSRASHSHLSVPHLSVFPILPIS